MRRMSAAACGRDIGGGSHSQKRGPAQKLSIAGWRDKKRSPKRKKEPPRRGAGALSLVNDAPSGAVPTSPKMMKRLPPAGYAEDGAGDVGGGVREKEQHGLGDFLGLADAAVRDGGADALDATRIAGGGMDLGHHHAGRHGVDADALARDFLREADRHRIDRALGRRIPDILARAAERRCDGADVDDGAAGSAMQRREALHRLAGAEKGPQDIEIENRFERRRVDGVDP